MNRIKELRTEKGMKQEELAADLHVRRQTVSRYETGLLDLDTDTIGLLCQIFGVTADYLLGFSSQRTAQISDADAALVDAFHSAPPNIRAGILATLQPFFEQETSTASPAEQEG